MQTFDCGMDLQDILDIVNMENRFKTLTLCGRSYNKKNNLEYSLGPFKKPDATFKMGLLYYRTCDCVWVDCVLWHWSSSYRVHTQKKTVFYESIPIFFRYIFIYLIRFGRAASECTYLWDQIMLLFIHEVLIQ